MNRGTAIVALWLWASTSASAAEPHLLALIEAGLAHGDAGLVAAGEGLLVPPGARPQPSVLLKLGDAHLHHGDNDGAAALYKRAAAGGAQVDALARGTPTRQKSDSHGWILPPERILARPFSAACVNLHPELA